MPLYTHVLAMKMGVRWIYAHSSFPWDSRDIKGLRWTMLEFISATYLQRNTFQLKSKYSIMRVR